MYRRKGQRLAFHVEQRYRRGCLFSHVVVQSENRRHIIRVDEVGDVDNVQLAHHLGRLWMRPWMGEQPSNRSENSPETHNRDGGDAGQKTARLGSRAVTRSCENALI